MSDNAGDFESLPEDAPESDGDKVGADFSAIRDRLRRSLVGKNRPAVLASAGISDRTLTRILAGATARRGTLASIADALGVLPDWLIDGTGPMTALSLQAAAAQAPAVHTFLMNTAISGKVDLDRLALALRMAARVVEKPDEVEPSEARAEAWRRRAKAVINLYDELTAHAAQEPS